MQSRRKALGSAPSGASPRAGAATRSAAAAGGCACENGGRLARSSKLALRARFARAPRRQGRGSKGVIDVLIAGVLHLALAIVMAGAAGSSVWRCTRAGRWERVRYP